MTRRRAPTLESILGQFRRQSGLYITGAGTSAGDAQFGQALMRDPGLAFVRGGSFSADIPRHSELTNRLIEAGKTLTFGDIVPGRELRPGTDEIPIREMVVRMTNHFGYNWMLNILARSRFEGRITANYAVFRRFRSGVIANYNHDGLAGDICGDVHRVVDMHGSIAAGYGSKAYGDWVYDARDYDLPVLPDGLLMCVPERRDDWVLRGRLRQVLRTMPAFVAVIGYSFSIDDGVSFDIFARKLRGFPGNIFVIDPTPSRVADMLSDALKSDRVFEIPVYWNVLARAVMAPERPLRSLDYGYERLLDNKGAGSSYVCGFPV